MSIMETNDTPLCPHCQSKETVAFMRYDTVNNGERTLFRCPACSTCFSETRGTPMENLKSPISKVAAALKIRCEGLGLRATARVLGTHKQTVKEWEERFADQKETLMLYAFCHQFVSLTFEGDELYTIVGKRTDPSTSTGWTAVIMERASRFLVDQKCGEKDEGLFKSVMETVGKFIERTGDLTFLSDGERRYGNMLFSLCVEALQNGKRGRPPMVLPEGVKIRVKNKGDQKRKRGPNRPKYQAPQREHPDTDQGLPNSEIHANHLEGQNVATRRRNSAFRRRTNTYAKTTKGLQRTLDVHLIIHNFARPHWSTGAVPSVLLGIMTAPLSLEAILTTSKTV